MTAPFLAERRRYDETPDTATNCDSANLLPRTPLRGRWAGSCPCLPNEIPERPPPREGHPKRSLQFLEAFLTRSPMAENSFPILIRFTGRIWSEKVGEHGFPYLALQLMALSQRF